MLGPWNNAANLGPPTSGIDDSFSNYNIAISRLELSKGTLLRYNNVLIEEEATPFVKTFGTAGR